MAKSTTILKSVSNIKNFIGSDEGKHIWHFSRVGGVNRVNLDRGSDLLALEFLDQKLWTALSCPVKGLEIDQKTLELIDSDNDERIRVPEIIEAVKWVTKLIKNPDELVKENKNLPLSSINDSIAEGQVLLASAKQILLNIGKPDEDKISVEESSDTVKIFANTKFNGDGIITEDSADEEEIKKLINDIISSQGSVTDRSGKPGISADHINNFYKNCNDYSAWYAKAEANSSKILPYGSLTANAFAALTAIKPKVEDYFLRCRLAEYDSDSVSIVNSLNARYEAISEKNLMQCTQEIAGFPITKIEANKPLSLTSAINPAWEVELNTFNELIIKPIFLNKESLTEAEWKSINKKFDDYIGWQSEKAGAEVEKLDILYIRSLLLGNTKESLMQLIDQDKALEENANNIFLVDKLARYYRDLYTLLNNYVTFRDFYSPDSKAIFQAGSLYIDQRCCDLCIKVSDMNKHNTIARQSGLCLIYCNCFSKTINQTMTIVAALTDGDIDNIEVGRNAIFYDRNGDDWDATITKVIDNPISIRQAFWSPYRKISRFISAQIEKFASAKEKEVDSAAAAGIEKTAAHAEAGTKGGAATPAAPQPFDIGKFVGIFAALSLALGAIGSVVASALMGFFSLEWWKMPIVIVAIVLCISGPSMIIAWLKLRKRNLAPLLDANAWAINARATINIPFGNTLTHLASLPENSKLNLLDPFAKKKKPAIPIIVFSIIVIAAIGFALWYFGFLTEWGVLGSAVESGLK